MSEKYWGATYKKHQKMRPSKRRRLNVKGDYDCSIINEDKDQHTLSYYFASYGSYDIAMMHMLQNNMIHMMQNNTFNTPKL